ncbi:MAG: methylmalonyl Co-A mutase-associated GTPase MeaB [bacterium]
MSTDQPGGQSPRVEAVLAGRVLEAARLMRDLDDGMPGAVEDLKRLYPHTGGAYVLGVTGNPGSGKSTIVDCLIRLYRQQSKRVGVVAIDPSSPFSGGAILGDRIRMQRHATDEGVFIRSLATRGHLGGLSRSTQDIITVMDAMGFDVVIVETVGVGQDEVDVVSTAHTSVVVVVPGLGDEIQAIKSGILEIADILAVNKADRDGADRTVADLSMMLDLRGRDAKKVRILKMVALKETGIVELVDAAEEHRRELDMHAEGRRRALERAEARLLDLIRSMCLTRALALIEADEGLVRLVESIAERELDPYTAAERIVTKLTSAG